MQWLQRKCSTGLYSSSSPSCIFLLNISLPLARIHMHKCCKRVKHGNIHMHNCSKRVEHLPAGSLYAHVCMPISCLMVTLSSSCELFQRGKRKVQEQCENIRRNSSSTRRASQLQNGQVEAVTLFEVVSMGKRAMQVIPLLGMEWFRQVISSGPWSWDIGGVLNVTGGGALGRGRFCYRLYTWRRWWEAVVARLEGCLGLSWIISACF